MPEQLVGDLHQIATMEPGQFRLGTIVRSGFSFLEGATNHRACKSLAMFLARDPRGDRSRRQALAVPISIGALGKPKDAGTTHISSCLEPTMLAYRTIELNEATRKPRDFVDNTGFGWRRRTDTSLRLRRDNEPIAGSERCWLLWPCASSRPSFDATNELVR